MLPMAEPVQCAFLAGDGFQREDALHSLEDRAHQVEADLRERLKEIATDAEAERSVLEARLQDLTRKVEEISTRAGV